MIIKTIIIEPICRGSRLDSVSLLINAVRNDSDVHLITRSDYDCPHFQELLGDVKALKIHTIQSNLDSKWTRILTKKEFSEIQSVLLDLDGRFSDGYRLIFAALDDYMWRMLVKPSAQLKNVNSVYIAKYRLNYLLEPKNIKDVILNIGTRHIVKKWNAVLLAFDDRIEGKKVGGKYVAIVPDPWIGDYSPRHRDMAREHFGVAQSDFVIVAVGKQVRRKGFSTLMNALPYILKKKPKAKLYVFGHVGEEYAIQWDSLKRKYSEQIRHYNEFFPERVMPLIYCLGDVVVLPYGKTHSATSGVLPRSAASGTPVVSSDHGAIGALVKKWQLGESIQAGNAVQLAEAITRVAAAEVYTGLVAYADYCSPKNCIKIIQKILKG
jgi:glycosyltransferase involved in cell wall biosynthesis